MPVFTTYDGTRLAHHEEGQGEPLVCLPGGAMRSSAYLGDLGGLSAGRRLILLDPRGTGDSEVPADPATYRVDHQVADVEALRLHLGLERLDLLAHSAGAALAQLYAAAHPERVRRLALITPTSWAVDLQPTTADKLVAAARRAGEPPYDKAVRAYEEILAGVDTDEVWDLAAPLFHGRWDERARACHVANAHEQNEAAAAAYATPGAFDPPATRAALRELRARVLVLVGGVDCNPPAAHAPRIAALFPYATPAVQPDAGHFPWLDDPARFARRVEAFLATGT
ncbi:alpha/beta hydrolase [Streptomyces sp. NPDC087917]|uniref:alpha/beta fold hydrolase n=1 Tax=Streptomyces sp. NPDC087917 TaxID=3155060 RepID=UPI00343F7E4B